MTASDRSDVMSALAVPAPDGGVVTHSDEDAAVTAEAGLADSGGAAGQCQRGAPRGVVATLVRGKAEHCFSCKSPSHSLVNHIHL